MAMTGPPGTENGQYFIACDKVIHCECKLFKDVLLDIIVICYPESMCAFLYSSFQHVLEVHSACSIHFVIAFLHQRRGETLAIFMDVCVCARGNCNLAIFIYYWLDSGKYLCGILNCGQCSCISLQANVTIHEYCPELKFYNRVHVYYKQEIDTGFVSVVLSKAASH